MPKIDPTRYIPNRHNKDPSPDPGSEDRPSPCRAPVHGHGGLLRQDLAAGGSQGTLLRVSIYNS